MAGFWAQQRVCGTGGADCLGLFVAEELHAGGSAEIFLPRSAQYDLRQKTAIHRMF